MIFDVIRKSGLYVSLGMITAEEVSEVLNG